MRDEQNERNKKNIRKLFVCFRTFRERQQQQNWKLWIRANVEYVNVVVTVLSQWAMNREYAICDKYSCGHKFQIVCCFFFYVNATETQRIFHAEQTQYRKPHLLAPIRFHTPRFIYITHERAYTNTCTAPHCLHAHIHRSHEAVSTSLCRQLKLNEFLNIAVLFALSWCFFFPSNHCIGMCVERSLNDRIAHAHTVCAYVVSIQLLFRAQSDM